MGKSSGLSRARHTGWQFESSVEHGIPVNDRIKLPVWEIYLAVDNKVIARGEIVRYIRQHSYNATEQAHGKIKKGSCLGSFVKEEA